MLPVTDVELYGNRWTRTRLCAGTPFRRPTPRRPLQPKPCGCRYDRHGESVSLGRTSSLRPGPLVELFRKLFVPGTCKVRLVRCVLLVGHSRV